MIKPNLKRERAAYIRTLYNYIMDKIYAKQKEIQQEMLSKIAEKNKILLNANTATFMFEGQWYANSDIYSDSPNKQLHPSLREEVEQLVYYTSFSQYKDKQHIIFSVQNSLNKAQHIADLFKLLPPSLFKDHNIDYKLFNINDPLSDQEILAIQEENKPGILCLNKLLITNLLLYK